jgi:hypothetical protein
MSERFVELQGISYRLLTREDIVEGKRAYDALMADAFQPFTASYRVRFGKQWKRKRITSSSQWASVQKRWRAQGYDWFVPTPHPPTGRREG